MHFMSPHFIPCPPPPTPSHPPKEHNYHPLFAAEKADLESCLGFLSQKMAETNCGKGLKVDLKKTEKYICLFGLVDEDSELL